LVAVGEPAGDGRTGQSGAPPDRHCSLSSALPRHPTVRVRSWSTVGDFVLLRHRIVRCHIRQSGAPLTYCSDFCAALFICQSRPLRTDSRCSAGSPDSPVNYNGACLRFLESGWLTPVRSWCTGHYPVAHRTVRCSNLQHTQVLLLLSNCVPNLNLLLVCVEPYAPVIHEF
jgi:hypothetical protein